MVESLDKDVANGLLDKTGSSNSGEDLVYRLRPTEKDRARKLRSAQSEWDRRRALIVIHSSAPITRTN